ncbi:MAG: hypothetical protein OJF49_004459 [Ktedonobacterales bacterium]|jgi:LmbE family N-acetylglucosaminyl deacetylase|nr:MAG: hypothetical protein OJF49_004459 [Ktedonobacterales bacterium]
MVATPLRLLAVLAHPDDESLGLGGTLAKYAAEGVETYLVTATRGQRGWTGNPQEYPGPEALGRIREGELRAATAVLGLRETNLLDYMDGDLDQARPAEIVALLAGHIRRIRPQVVMTFDPYGGYGHPDHIAICQFTSAALVAAASADDSSAAEQAAHTVAKLYYMAVSARMTDTYQDIFGELLMYVDGVARPPVPWPEWAITTRIDTSAYWRQILAAVSCHTSQVPEYGALVSQPDERYLTIWGEQTYYRVYSQVTSGRAIERDLFEGLR